jgi:hypothetical protein
MCLLRSARIQIPLYEMDNGWLKPCGTRPITVQLNHMEKL